MQAIRNGIPWAGLAAGPAAWAVSFELNYSIAHWQCAANSHPAPWFSLIGIVVALTGAFLSWRAWGNHDHGLGPPMAAHARRFLAGASLGVSALFALVILLQLMAGLVFGGCEL